MASRPTPTKGIDLPGHGYRVLELAAAQRSPTDAITQRELNDAFKASGLPPKVDVDRLRLATREILIAIGEDPDREGLRDTPRRYAEWWREFIEYAPGTMDTAFTRDSDQMIVVGGIRVWTLCEHHLLPFWCDVAIGYISREKVLGLSKLGRIAHFYAHRLQLQEQLVAQVAEHVSEATGASDVAVVAQGEHSCMTMRGIKTPATMSSTKLLGIFKQIAARNEFYTLAGITK